MPYNPFDFTGGVNQSVDAHGPLHEKRLQPGEYSQDFLKDLQVTGAVKTVPSTWKGNFSALPQDVSWILYDNGELERVRFS